MARKDGKDIHHVPDALFRPWQVPSEAGTERFEVFVKEKAATGGCHKKGQDDGLLAFPELLSVLQDEALTSLLAPDEFFRKQA